MDFLSERPKSRLDAFRGSEGRKDLAEPPLASEGSSWPGEKESSVLSSPSCLERKGAWQNPADHIQVNDRRLIKNGSSNFIRLRFNLKLNILGGRSPALLAGKSRSRPCLKSDMPVREEWSAENEAKVQVATEKQPEFMKEAQGMEADGTRLFGKTRELGTRGSTGAPPEGSHCSGVEAVTAKAAVSGTDSLVSLEPVSQEEEERCNGPSASPRQAGEETLPKENEERNTVFDNTSSILLDNCRLALPLERRSNVDTSSSSSGFEASKRSSKLGHRPRDVPEVNSRVQKEFHLRKEETLKSNWSFGEEGDFEALSQTGKTEVKLLVSDSKEQKVSDALDHSFNFVHKGTVEIQKGQALHSCWEEGDDFHLECGRLQAPAEQLTVSVNVPSEIGVGDVALFEKPLEGFSGADSIPKDTFHFLGRGRLTVMAIENWTLSLKGNDFLCFQDNCASPHSLNHSSLQVGSRGLARGVRGSRYFRGVDTGALADQESLQMRHLSDEFLFPLQADPRLSLRGSTDFLPPSKVSAMLCLARLLRPRKAFASSPKRGSCAAEEEEGWERARGEKPNTEPSGSKMPRPRNSNPWQKHKETTGGVSPTGPALVLGEVPRSKGSALTGSSLKAGTLKGPRASVPLEWAFPSDLLKPGYSGHGPALGAKGDGLHSADELVAKSPPEKFSFKNRLFYISSSPHQTFLQPGPPSLESPERTEQIFVKFREGREIPNLTCAGCSSRRAPKEKICSSQKRGALILPSLKAFSSSLARERFLAQGTNRHWSLFALSVENASTPLRQDVLRSNDSEQNLGEAQEQSGLTDDETELPFPVSAFSKEALETLLESRKVTFSFQDAICTPLPSICLFKDVLEIDCGKAKDSSELTVLKWPTENVSYALKTKHLFCRRAAAEIVGGSIMFCFLKGETLETFFSGTESHLLEVESRQGWAGGQKKPLEGHLVGHGIQVPFEEGRVADLGAQLSLPKEAERKSAAPCDLWRPEWGVRVKPKGRSPLKRRCFGNGQPLGCVSQGSAASREDPQPRPFAPVGHVVQNREEESPLHAVREFKRPKRDKRGGVCFRKQSQRANRQNATVVAALWALPGGEGCPQMESPGVFAHSCRAGRLLPPLWQESVRACIQAVLNQFRASEIRSGSPFLGNLVHRDSATKPAAPQKLKTLPWDRPTKRQGGQSRLWGSLWPRPHAHEVCLRTLSALADKLLAPVGTPQKCKPLSCSSEPLPSAEKCSRGRSKKVLEIISFASLKFSFNPRLPRGRRSVKMAASQAPTESRILCCFQLTPSAFSSLVFPGSVHLGMDARKPQDPTPQLALGDPPPLQTSRRRLSSCLSSSCSNVQGGTGGPAELWATFACEGGGAVAQNPGCPARGLRTALAAFPHGCHQLWTRRRSLARRISTVPKVTLLQFARGLKGLKRAPGVSAEFFSSLRCSLGRALSIRNQQGAPPAGPSECPPLHPNPCQGQPASPASASLGHGNRTYLAKSSTEPPLVPDLPSDPPWVGNKDALRQEPSCLDPAQPPLGLPAPGLGDEPEASHLPGAETPLEKVDSEKRPKKVSQIRIRKTIPKPDPNLTPMGLPRQKRLKKTEFSLEEIYTNKNYKSPPPTRCLETIFEEPKEKNGSLISVSQQKRKRILEFPDFTVPRKRKARSRAKGASGSTRAQKAAVGGRELDLLLVQKLTDLESFFAKEEKQEPTLGR